MPLVPSDFSAPWWLPGGHLQTLLPRFIRRLALKSQPVYINTPDNDRLVADYYPTADKTKPLVIISHGLEGTSQSIYVLGFIRALQKAGFAALAWNMRSCGREDNITPLFYHSGCSPDLDAVITWAAEQGYSTFYLAGYSLGANVTLKWLGEQGDQARKRGVVAAVTASAPADLRGCVKTLGRWSNTLYHRHFVNSMKNRLRAKAKKFPDHFDLSGLDKVRTLWEIDEYYTAPLNGFRDAADYHAQCSSRFYVAGIRVPTLLVTARNDPFFDESCFPEDIARESDWLHFETPRTGGHVGFLGGRSQWWLDRRYLEFYASATAERHATDNR